MSLTYTWKVTGIKTRDEVNAEGETLQNAVVQTYWQKIGTDAEGNEGTFSGATPFTAKDVPSGEFVPLADLTEETVIGWIQSIVVGGYEEHVNGMIQKQIDDKTITDAKLPWAPEEPEPTEPANPEA
jgi:hypothetical protein